MSEYSPEFWHWFVLATVFGIIEVLAPGTFFLWLGISAGLVGVLAWLVPTLDWRVQTLIFTVLAVVAVAISRRYLRSRPIQSDRPLLNLRGHQYVGRTFTLDEPIVNGRGRIKVDDSIWRVEGDDCPAGRRVRVNGVDGVILRVEAAAE
ncbi:MAG: NfeD family protein [Ectothiorhodospiraceae bacterium]|nr:NfeD family protein [Chromatiales bacterium]MCP5157560.1 NfeD family protein [Ectothiorhodospiraceae bacterium]